MSLDEELPLWDHLEELARRLRKIVVALAIATFAFVSLPSDPSVVLSLDFSSYKPLVSSIMEFIQSALLPEGVNLIAFNWLDTFYIYFLVALALGFLTTLPLTAYEIYKFINPALYPKERRPIVGFVAAFIILFSLGTFYAYFILLPTTFNILYRFVYQSNIVPFYSVKSFFNMVAAMMLGSGVFYTFPLVIYILVKADLMQVATLKEYRKQLFVGLLILTAIVTPDPTPFSMLLMAVPFYALYELTIQILGRMKKPEEPLDELLEAGLEASRELLARMEGHGAQEQQKEQAIEDG